MTNRQNRYQGRDQTKPPFVLLGWLAKRRKKQNWSSADLEWRHNRNGRRRSRGGFDPTDWHNRRGRLGFVGGWPSAGELCHSASAATSSGDSRFSARPSVQIASGTSI